MEIMAVRNAILILNSREVGLIYKRRILSFHSSSRVYFDNLALNSFIKNGSWDSALQMFDSMHERDIVSWNSIISGYTRFGRAEDAFGLFKQMISLSINENPSTFSTVLRSCSEGGFHREGIQIHCRILRLGFHSNLIIGTAIVNFYMQCGFPDDAMYMFDEVPERNVATWNSVLRGFSDMYLSHELFKVFLSMRSSGVDANSVTYSYLIHGCGNGGYLDQGKQFHCHTVKNGMFYANSFITNAFVDFYSSCGLLMDAKRSFDCIPSEDVISWNSIISVFAEGGFVLEALELFSQMQWFEKKPSIRSFVSILNLSSRSANHLIGQQIHGVVLQLGFDRCSVFIQSALVDMYGRCGKIEKSVLAFEQITEKNLECYNSLLNILSHHGLIEDTLEIFRLMIFEGIEPDHITFSVSLKASHSSKSASSAFCNLLNCFVIKLGFESSKTVSCSLIDSYSKSGQMNLSYRVFKQVQSPNLICFTAIINGYGRNGLGMEGLKLFELMINRNVKPDCITFLAVLTCCDHSGMVKEARSIFESMKSVHGIDPDRRHFACMINLLGRAGLIDEAQDLLQKVESDSPMLSSLLHSCSIYRNEKIGRRLANLLLKREPENPATYLQIFNFYSQIGDSEMAVQIRQRMVALRMRKETGYSFIEVNHPSPFDSQIMECAISS